MLPSFAKNLLNRRVILLFEPYTINIMKRKAKTAKKGKSFIDSIMGMVPEIAREAKKRKKAGESKETYKEYKKRKERERKEPVRKKLARAPAPKEIMKRPRPVGTGHENKIIKKPAVGLKTGVPGFDELIQDGIPKGAAILVAGGAGSGKTIFCLQQLNYAARNGEKCLYISFEESEKRLKDHMKEFGWNPEELEKKGLLMIKQADAFDISTSVEALLAKAKGELMINLKEVPGLIPHGFKPSRVVVDSLSALAASFTSKEESYRIYMEQLFRYFEALGVTSFLISETDEVPTKFSETGVEEFLSDGVVVFYNIRRGNIRENAVEVLKLRGVKHEKKIVAMQITPEGMVVYPEQEVFGGLDDSRA